MDLYIALRMGRRRGAVKITIIGAIQKMMCYWQKGR